jgi:hypothetical protein
MLCRQGEIFWVDGREGRADGMGMEGAGWLAGGGGKYVSGGWWWW